MRLDNWLREASARLDRVGITSHRMEAQILACHALLVDRSFVLTHPEQEINELAFESLLQRREQHEPLAYILGFREFYSRKFRVDRSVLIPRHETEILVEECLKDSRENLTVLDIGTGSGCIAITLKLERPSWTVHAVDISASALQIARENAETLGADVSFRRSDLFEHVRLSQYDLIVSNPPYIGRDEALPIEVREFEPGTALFADDDGLAIYRRLASEGASRLSTDGRMVLEIGQTQAKAMRDIFAKVVIIADLDGNDRVAVVTHEA
jgi:release factor glutamine methyltransferase